ncbi:MAG: ABC transporter substrate-binding protein [Planctomycetes bacterium]|nr:ABC transporter substrate-binding protein [Planctomycetota bacterium]
MFCFSRRLLVGLLLCLASTGCNRSQNSGKTLVVGGVLSKTGGAAAYGGDADKGAALAAEHITANGGPIRIEYVSLDDKSDKTEAVKVARTLVEANKVQVILGPAISPSALSVGKFAEEREIPVVATSATQDEVTASDQYDRTYVARVCFNDSYQGAVLAKFATSSLKKKTAAVIYDKTLSYSIGLSKTFRDEFTRLGGTVRHEENYSIKDSDYSALIDKVATFDVDLLFIPGWDENVGPMLKQAGKKWDRFILLGGDGWPTPRLLELAAGNIKDAYAVSHYAPEDPDPRVRDFQKAYREKYGQEPSPFAALGYDAMMLIWDAAKRAKSFSGPDLRDAINGSKDVSLVTGTLTFDKHRNPSKEAVIVRIFPDRIAFQERVRP